MVPDIISEQGNERFCFYYILHISSRLHVRMEIRKGAENPPSLFSLPSVLLCIYFFGCTNICATLPCIMRKHTPC